MSDATTHLLLPYILAAQAQKHVTHNEALRILDGLVQLSVLDRDLTAPPGSPADGDRYIVGSGATGSWAGWDLNVALWTDGAWLRLPPRTGWRAWIEDEGLLLVYDGAGWIGTTPAALQNLTLLGLGTTADTANPFSAKLNAALWTALAAGEGGTGDLRYTMNKEGAGNVLSLLLQSGFSGRAELGLVGSDDLALRVSPDGAAWTDGLVIDKDTGGVTMPKGFSTGGTGPAGRLGGHAMVICGEKANALVAGTHMSMGNGAYNPGGAVMPAPGKVVAMGLSIAAGTEGANTLSASVNKVPSASHQVSLSYSGSGVETAWSDFSAAPLAFAAGDALNAYVDAGVSAQVNTSLYVVFD